MDPPKNISGGGMAPLPLKNVLALPTKQRWGVMASPRKKRVNNDWQGGVPPPKKCIGGGMAP